ncbi:hypothetical protein BDF19DRAFT_442450 [Syncephalis fuscata]|nr:hypothetical protein BDF19DRAFT_442450 [Syncephalis fuscata]
MRSSVAVAALFGILCSHSCPPPLGPYNRIAGCIEAMSGKAPSNQYIPIKVHATEVPGYPQETINAKIGQWRNIIPRTTKDNCESTIVIKQKNFIRTKEHDYNLQCYQSHDPYSILKNFGAGVIYHFTTKDAVVNGVLLPQYHCVVRLKESKAKLRR